MDTKAIDAVIKTLQRVPLIWAHKHYVGEERLDFDQDLIDVCETCQGIWEGLVASGEVCGQHPEAYSEADYCEGCEAEVIKKAI